MMMESLVVLLTITSVIAVTIAAIDLVWQRFDHARRLRMSYQDLREEAKQSDGDPHMKAQRRSRARGDRHQPDAARRAEGRRGDREPDALRGGAEVVARPRLGAGLRRQGRGRAGAEDPRDRRHRRGAGARDPPTARALHAAVEIGREIAPEHYRAVAAAIRFADRMRPGGAGAGPAVTPSALRQLLAAGRGAQGARPGAARRGCSSRTAGSRRRSRSWPGPRRATWPRASTCRWRSRGCGSPGPTSASRAAQRRRAELAAASARRGRRRRRASASTGRSSIWWSAPSGRRCSCAPPARSARRRRRPRSREARPSLGHSPDRSHATSVSGVAPYLERGNARRRSSRDSEMRIDRRREAHFGLRAGRVLSQRSAVAGEMTPGRTSRAVDRRRRRGEQYRIPAAGGREPGRRQRVGGLHAARSHLAACEAIGDRRAA